MMASSRTKAHVYFEVHVEPNLEEWANQPTDLRLAMNAAISLYHMADHFWHAFESVNPSCVFGTGSAGLFRAELARRNVQFAVLRDVAEAHKHMELNRTTRTVTRSSQTGVGEAGYGECGYDTGPYGGGPSILVEQDDKTKHHFSYLVTEVEKFWRTMLV